MKIDPKTQDELVDAARFALANPEQTEFWAEVKQNMDRWDESRKDLVKPRPNHGTT